jgi:transcriptional regulator with XRE-family HTH domain
MSRHPSQDIDIAKRIFAVRKSFSLKQKNFAEKLGVSTSYISRIERGLGSPSAQLLKAISAIYGIEEVWLRTGKGLLGEQFLIWKKSTPEEVAEEQMIRKDPFYEGLRLTLEDSAEALRRIFNTLSIYKSGMKSTDEIRAEVLMAKQTMLTAIDILRLLTDSLMKWEEEAAQAQKGAKGRDK